MRHMIYNALQRVSMVSNISLLYLLITNRNYSDGHVEKKKVYKAPLRSYDRVLLHHMSFFFFFFNIYKYL